MFTEKLWFGKLTRPILFTYPFVPPNLAREINGTIYILSDTGLALLGHAVDIIVEWNTNKGEKAYRIDSVNDL